MIDRNSALPVVRQCEILSLSRSSVYYRRRPVPPEDLALMRRIDELHLELPFAGARMLRDLLRLEGYRASRQRIARLMRGLPIIRPNPVWAMDITYIPMERGFVYLAAVIGQGCWRDNVFVERLWKRVKYEEIDLHAYDTVADARQALARYFQFYNTRRPHSSLDGQTPDTVYFNSLPQLLQHDRRDSLTSLELLSEQPRPALPYNPGGDSHAHCSMPPEALNT